MIRGNVTSVYPPLVIQNSRVRNKSGLQNYYITIDFTFQNERYKEIKTIWNRVKDFCI
jgi:hypothetical protein